MRQGKIAKPVSVFFGLLITINLLIPSPAWAVPYSIIALPDTQWYSRDPDIFNAQLDWIVANQASRNIIYVVHLGDLVQGEISGPDWLSNSAEWGTASDAMQKLEDAVPEIPYGVHPGNHDLGDALDASGGGPNGLTDFTDYFPRSRFSGKSYFGGTYDAANYENNYSLFEFSGTEFIAVNLAFANSVGSVQQDIIDNWLVPLLTTTFPNRKAIISSHYILDEDGILGPFGQAIYDALENHPNLFLMLGGHERDREGNGRGEAWVTRVRAGMDDVHILLANYQDYNYSGTNSGPIPQNDSGYLRILTFDTDHDDVAVETFSPWIAIDATPASSPGGLCIDSPSDFPNSAVSNAALSVSNFALTYGTPDIFPGVVLLIDDSGSMRLGADGTSESDPDLRRIKFAKDSAKAFLDMLNLYGANSADFSVAAFPANPYAGCTTNQVTGMTRVNATSRDTAKTAIEDNLLAPGPSTPLLAGIDFAADTFTTQWCRTVVALTDGYHNCPSLVSAGDAQVETLLAELNNNSNRAFTIAFGEPGDTDNLLLQNIGDRTTPANYSGSQFYDATQADFDPATWSASGALNGTFKEILRDVLSLETAVDPLDVIESGQTKNYEVNINEHDHKVSFYLSWRTNMQNRLTLTVYDSNHNPISVNEPGVSLDTGATYLILTVDQKFLKQRGRIGVEPWRIEVGTNDLAADETEPFQYSVIMDSDLKMRPGLERNIYYAGDTIVLSAQLFELGQPVPGLSSVEVMINAPDDGMGNWLSTNQVSDKELAQVPLKRGGEVMVPFQRKSIYLNDVRGLDWPGRNNPGSLRLYDDGTHGDVTSNDGIYTNSFSNTGKEGIYSFYFKAQGPTSGGNAFNREQMVQKYLPVRVVPEAVAINVVSLGIEDLKQFDVQVTPRDSLGNYLGPGRSGLIQLVSTGGSFTGNLRDNLDGSYSQTLNVPPTTAEEDVQVTVKVDEASKNFNLSDELKTFALSFHAGSAIPNSNFSNLYDPGINLGLDVEYSLSARLSAIGELQHSQFKSAQSGLSDTYWLSLTGGLKYEFVQNPGAWKPYVAGGIGIYDPKSGSAEPGMHIGVGLDRAINSRWSVEIGADYHNIFVSGDDVEFSVIRAGLIYQFGGP